MENPYYFCPSTCCPVCLLPEEALTECPVCRYDSVCIQHGCTNTECASCLFKPGQDYGVHDATCGAHCDNCGMCKKHVDVNVRLFGSAAATCCN